MLKNKIILLVAFLTSIFLAACSSGGGGFFGGGGNAGPPEWQAGSPEADVMDSTAFVISRLNKQGTVYCVAIPRGNDAPSPRQVQDGTDSDDTAVPNGSAPTDNDNFSSLKIIGLDYDTDYDVYCVAEGTTSNLQAAATKIEISTNERNTLFVSDSSGNDANDGSIENPKKTINGAVGAVVPGIIRIYVSAGTYNENVTLEDGLSLYGGFSADDWRDRDEEDRENATYRTFIRGVDAAGSGSGVRVTGVSGDDWILEGFVIEVHHTGNSHGVNVADITGMVTIQNNTIHGGPGSNESNGIYIHGTNSKTLIHRNDINGGASGASSNGIYIETAADQNIVDNNINGGSGSYSSKGITITYPLAETSIITRNNISGGSNIMRNHGISLKNNQVGSLQVIISGNYIVSNANPVIWDESRGAFGIHATGTNADRKIQPRIFNNVIEATITNQGFAYAMYFMNLAGSPLVYNNTLVVQGGPQGSSGGYGIFAVGSVGLETYVDVKNNIFYCQPSATFVDYAIYEGPSMVSESNIYKNDFYGWEYIVFGTDGFRPQTIADLIFGRPDSDGSTDVDPALSAGPEYDLTAASPATVTQGGDDLSGVPSFPEDSGNGVKLDKKGTLRSVPWSMGAYERD
jgi:hypothetical protein